MTEDELILTHILQCTRSQLYLRKPQLTLQEQKQFELFKARRQQGESLQYILGVCDFMGLELKVDSRVLIPRPETEILVEEAIRLLSSPTKVFGHDKMILDLGTGSGNIAIALAKFLPSVSVMTVDVSKDALDLAKENARRHGVEKRIEFVQEDILVSLRAKRSNLLKDCFVACAPRNDTVLFDLIISNPPYIPTAQMSQLPKDVQKEPRLALEAGDDGLRFYREIIKYTPSLLREGAYLMMEFGDNQAEAIKNLVLKQPRFSNIQILQDLTGRNRIICTQWCGEPSL